MLKIIDCQNYSFENIKYCQDCKLSCYENIYSKMGGIHGWLQGTHG